MIVEALFFLFVTGIKVSFITALLGLGLGVYQINWSLWIAMAQYFWFYCKYRLGLIQQNPWVRSNTSQVESSNQSQVQSKKPFNPLTLERISQLVDSETDKERETRKHLEEKVLSGIMGPNYRQGLSAQNPEEIKKFAEAFLNNINSVLTEAMRELEEEAKNYPTTSSKN
jgi:hypothetical protein